LFSDTKALSPGKGVWTDDLKGEGAWNVQRPPGRKNNAMSLKDHDANVAAADIPFNVCGSDVSILGERSVPQTRSLR
jgi:hypothetical protein